jgi:DNA-binding GntR family transcriptional regulator
MAYDPDGAVDHLAYEAPYRQLAGILKARIERGDWDPGRPIPSEARLAEHYGVARNTVRRSIALLVDQDVLVVAPQRGTYVKSRD